jgi:hypothetical protein
MSVKTYAELTGDGKKSKIKNFDDNNFGSDGRTD